ncbi:MAG: hypothetical protein SGI97_00970 [candidate division Zixibacteria bacterium]|nr:hypothetical protein [candidate division Zixibacteria bacterium]
MEQTANPMKISKQNAATAPALIAGTGLSALGLLRSLSQANIPCFCLSPDLGIVRYSRWSRPLPSQVGHLNEDMPLAQYLEHFPADQAVLFPCSDHWTAEAARLPLHIRERFKTIVPEQDSVNIFLDKGLLATMMQDQGLAHPRTFIITSERDFSDIPETIFEQSFLKPRDSQSFFRHFARKGFFVRSKDDALKRYSTFADDGFEMILQEYIPGPAHSHYFIDGYIGRDGLVKGRLARRRLRMFPLDFGNSTYLRSISLTDISPAIESLDRLFAAVNYKGIFSAEFKFDERDQTFKLIEVNIRPWWYIQFASACGVNVALMAYNDALGRNIKTVSGYKIGEGLIHSYYDIHAARALYKRGELTLIEWIRSWLTSTQSDFSWSDPLPTAAFWSDKLASKFWRLIDTNGTS